ncbi:hypothetical protein EDB19DRAFT_1663856 [Suillus lakei]|nr:hypothetical protein EDB19DRAFT_1663856 [Suillus lakei]
MQSSPEYNFNFPTPLSYGPPAVPEIEVLKQLVARYLVSSWTRDRNWIIWMIVWLACRPGYVVIYKVKVILIFFNRWQSALRSLLVDASTLRWPGQIGRGIPDCQWLRDRGPLLGMFRNNLLCLVRESVGMLRAACTVALEAKSCQHGQLYSRTTGTCSKSTARDLGEFVRVSASRRHVFYNVIIYQREMMVYFKCIEEYSGWYFEVVNMSPKCEEI